jgi:glycosyltransferase involved in cell wall biosynthesis
MRYVWDQVDAYLGQGLRRALARPLVSHLRSFDVRTSAPSRVQRFVAISQCVAQRIARHYRRDASVVYPPVDVDRLRPDHSPPDDFYLLVGGFVPYKREDLAIEAFRRLGHQLVVAGDGPTRARLAARAPSNVTFLGRVADAELARLYARCRALIYPQEEDFGIVAVEAQACGRPVIALGRGGALETVVPLCSGPPATEAVTGLHFQPQTADALVAAIRRFEAERHTFDPQAIRAHAERFSPARFRAEIGREVELVLAANRSMT